MPELIDTPVTLGSFAEILPADRDLFLVVTGEDGQEGRVQLAEALSVIEAGDLPALASLLATPFVDRAIVSTVLDLGAAATTSVNVTSTSGTIASLGTSAPEGAEYLLKMNGAVTFTHGASLVCPEALDVVAYSGMMVWVKKDAGNVWRVLWYTNRVRVTGGGASRVIFNGAALSGNITITLPNGAVTIPAGTLAAASTLLGIGQTWTEVTASRASGVSYQNTSARPMQVAIWYGLGSAATRNVQVSPDNTNWSNVLTADTSTQSLRCNMIVPPGWYYRINGGAVTNLFWAELS